MNKCKLFLIIYIWALIDALLISWYLLPYIITNLENIVNKNYLKLLIPFIMISLVMPLVFWIEVPLTTKYCCKKNTNNQTIIIEN